MRGKIDTGPIDTMNTVQAYKNGFRGICKCCSGGVRYTGTHSTAVGALQALHALIEADLKEANKTTGLSNADKAAIALYFEELDASGHTST